MKPITKAVIPAAGLGTRFLPATKACPKEMLPIVDKPTIQYIIEEALASGGRLQVQIEQDLSSNYISGIHLIKKSVEQFIRSVVA